MLIFFVLWKPELTTLFQLHSSVDLDIISPTDIPDKRGGLLVYIKSHLLSRRLTNYIMPKVFKLYKPVELNVRKEK